MAGEVGGEHLDGEAVLNFASRCVTVAGHSSSDDIRSRLMKVVWGYGTLIGLLILVVVFSLASDTFLR